MRRRRSGVIMVAIAVVSILIGVIHPTSAFASPSIGRVVAPQEINGGQSSDPMFVAGYFDCEDGAGCFPAYAYFQPSPHAVLESVSGGTRVVQDQAASWFADDPGTNPADPVLAGWKQCNVTSGGTQTFCLNSSNGSYGCVYPLLESIDQMAVCEQSGTNYSGYVFSGNWYYYLFSLVASGTGLSYCGGIENVQEDVTSAGYSPPVSDSYDIPYGTSSLGGC